MCRVTRYGTRSALAACLLPLLVAAPRPVVAQDGGTGLQAAMARDIAGLERKYAGLAGAMPPAAWEWRPADGVRSAGEVLCHVAGANYRIPGFFGVEAPAEAAAVDAACAVEDGAARRGAVPAALAASFAHARQAVMSVADARLDEGTKLFGQDTTVRAAMLLYVTHMHEHLGQLVAYARTNGVVPPWSTGG
ncbi:MAG: DinB family protein [Gemmatimonadota bacterium]